MPSSPLLAFLVSIAAPQAQTTAEAAPVPIRGTNELERLSAELPVPARYAKLLNMRELVTAEDYPKGALEREEEGKAETWLLVGANGRAERCGIEVSSGSQDLDAKTCEVLITKARFEVARDKDGKPVKSIFHQALSWTLDDGTAQELLDLEAATPKPAIEARLLNVGEIASGMDYPLEALRHEEEGVVDSLLLIGSDGRVERCGVDHSSGFPSLDSQTCNVLMAHGQFRPARDKRGQPIQSVFHERLVWRLQRTLPTGLHDVASVISMTVGPENRVRKCDVKMSVDDQQQQQVPQQLCELGTRGTALVAAAKAKSKLYESLVVFESWTIQTANRAMPSVGRRKGEVLIALRSATASYDVSGSRTRCTNSEAFGIVEGLDDVCNSPDDIVPMHVERGDNTPLQNVRWLTAVYLKDEPE